VDWHPLNVDTALVGSSARHRWAEAGSVDVSAFYDEPMLFNPPLSEEWMGPFWLADIRPRREASTRPAGARTGAARCWG
jgi:hypothetical protein